MRTHRLRELLFPRRCPFCGAPLKNEWLCDACRRDLPFTADTLLRRGGDYGRCCAPLYYEERVRRAVLDMKFHHKLGGMNCFGELMAQCAAAHYSGAFDAVTWVPISKQRLKERGYDQAYLLSLSVCEHWQCKPVATLRKTVDNQPQSGLKDAAARRGNVLGVYEPLHSADNVGKRWLLIDDVMTTGATLGECARILRQAGAADVMCLTLATSRG